MSPAGEVAVTVKPAPYATIVLAGTVKAPEDVSTLAATWVLPATLLEEPATNKLMVDGSEEVLSQRITIGCDGSMVEPAVGEVIVRAWMALSSEETVRSV